MAKIDEQFQIHILQNDGQAPERVSPYTPGYDL